jgi:hypothetical protein
MSGSSLHLVFTLARGDILNCRMATYHRQIAEFECVIAMRANSDRWARIIEVPCSVPETQKVWIAVNNIGQFSEIQVAVYDRAETVPSGTEWVEDLVVVN